MKVRQRRRKDTLMQLTVNERMALLALLPEESNYPGVREINKTRMILGLTDEESKELEVVSDGERISWNPEKALGMIVDLPFGEWMTETIRGVLRELHEEYKLRPEIMTLYEKFIKDYE